MNSVFVFLVGLCCGSFVNCLSWRLENWEKKGRQRRQKRGRKALRPYEFLMTPSFCDHCGRPLLWWENVPVVSWLMLRGKCRTCHSPIPCQYPLIEFLTGVLFWGIWLNWGARGDWREMGFWWLMTVALMVVLASDWWYGIIPDKVLFPAAALTVIYQGWADYRSLLTNYLLAGMGAFLFFYTLVFLTKGRGMGMGDVKLAFLMGLMLGWPKILVAGWLAFVSGAFYASFLLLLHKKKFSDTMPLGPFLVGGVFLALFFGERLWFLFLPI